MKEELQAYLARNYNKAKLEIPHSIFGNIHIRFQLGTGPSFKIIRNGIEIEWWKERRRMSKVDKINFEKHKTNSARQATERATILFKETFENAETEIWIIIYEYAENLFNNSDNILFNQFSKLSRKGFYEEYLQVNTKMLIEQKDGTFINEKTNAKITIGKLKVKDIKSEKILNGIANNEMGIEPSIPQNIYFLDPATNKGFYMYDDRGCYIWADQPEKIKSLYETRNDWIVDYHRKEIDKYFKTTH